MKLKENERIDDLEYKGLKVIQQEDGFCFGIDSVLLSDFAKDIKKEAVGLDLGTGTGILGILLCGKTELSKIYGIEIQEQVAEMAIVVMYDACGVRRAAGKQAALLNKLVETPGLTGIQVSERLVEVLGHTPIQVFVGALIGVVVGLIA